jgi:hypothetical protein
VSARPAAGPIAFDGLFFAERTTMAYDYKGVLHVHSTLSDGHGTVDEIMAAANEAGLDFVVLSDHNHLRAAAEGHERWYDSTLLIVGAEISPEYNHYLALGLPPDAPIAGLNEKPPQTIIDTVNRLGGFGFIAHPDHTGTTRFGIRSYAWKDWSASGFSGMSVWDLMTDWQEVVEKWSGGMEVYDNFAKHLRGPKEVTLKRWDEYNKTGRVIGFGEIDNHATPRTYENREIIVFPYAQAFRTVTTHVLLDKPLPKDYTQAKTVILGALREGRFYISFDYFDDPADFQFEASDGERTVNMGGELVPTEDCELFLQIPGEAVTRFLCDGELLWEEQGVSDRLIEIEQPGTYRVEVYREGMIWILSNPIFVRGE